MHSDIVTLQFKNQTMISHRECARLLGKQPHHVSRDIIDLQTALMDAGLELEFSEGLFLVNVDRELYPNLDKNRKPKRGRPRSPEWLMNSKGFFWLASKYNTVEALEWKSKVLRALEVGQELANNVLPAMQAELDQLRAENAQLREKPKALKKSRKNEVISPVLQENLFGQVDAIRWERRNKDTLDQETQAKAHARHLRKMLKGIAQKHDALVEAIELMEGNKTAQVIRLLTNRKDLK